jgi:hypothetical protein
MAGVNWSLCHGRGSSFFFCGIISRDSLFDLFVQIENARPLAIAGLAGLFFDSAIVKCDISGH